MNDPVVQLEVARIKGSKSLPVPPFPHPPELASASVPIRVKLKQIQGYITSLQFGDLVVYHFDSIEGINGGTESVAFPNSRYNYTGQDYFVKKKDRGFRHVTSTAKLIIREALPIRCVDAVFLGAYLTADMANVDRFPVCFRSSVDGQVFRHIILAIRSAGVWGALGLSRRESLMYKELRYASFSKLIEDFRESYASNWHRLEQVWVGFPLPHDISSNVPVKWKVVRAVVDTDQAWTSAAPDLDRFVSCAATLFERFSATGTVPDHPLLRGDSSGVSDDAEGNKGCPIDGKDGARSPGALCNRSLLRGRQRTRGSMIVCAGTPSGRRESSLTRHIRGGTAKSTTGVVRTDLSGLRSGSPLLVSPPRTRARTAWGGSSGRQSFAGMHGRRPSVGARIPAGIGRVCSAGDKVAGSIGASV